MPREFLLLAMFGGVGLILLLATFPMEMLLAMSAVYLALISVACVPPACGAFASLVQGPGRPQAPPVWRRKPRKAPPELPPPAAPAG